MEKYDLNIFVGTQPEQMLATKLLEYSIKKHTKLKVNVQALYKAVELKGIKIPTPKDKINYPRTPFSFQRFAIPALSNYQGRSLYVDSDMLVFSDIKELFEMPFNNAEILCAQGVDGSRRPQFSVMILDCDALKWNVIDIIDGLDKKLYDYSGLMYEMKAAKKINQSLSKYWNDLEGYTKGKTRLTHFTDMHRQPWLSVVNPLAPIWVTELANSINDGFITLEELEENINLGFVRPSLRFQIINKKYGNKDVTFKLKLIDHLYFVKPHEFKNNFKKVTQYGVKPNLVGKINRFVYSSLQNTLLYFSKILKA
ncbi:MAG: glycosyl transferase [Sphingobacteriales bacterium]|nr:glycosyl transferase [Sphingobacteriales bacterium]